MTANDDLPAELRANAGVLERVADRAYSADLERRAASRIVDLEIALQNYMDACQYADKATLVSAIGAAHTQALLLIPKRVYPAEFWRKPDGPSHYANCACLICRPLPKRQP